MLIGCRAEWSSQQNYLITGGGWGTGQGSGGLMLFGCLSDRGGYDGVKVNSTGSAAHNLVGLTCRRDGRNNGTGGGGYAALAVAGATTPVVVDGLAVYPGVDDDGAGVNSPQVGVSATGSTHVAIASGYVHAATSPIVDGGTNGHFGVSPAIGTATGATTAPIRTAPAAGSSGDAATNGSAGLNDVLAWNFDPINANSSLLAVSGTIYLQRIDIQISTLVTGIDVSIGVQGATVTTGYVGIYNAAGTRLGVSANQTTAWQTVGDKVIPLTAAVTLAPGTHFVAFLTQASTIPRPRGGSPNQINIGLSAARLRASTILTGQSSLPSSLTLANAAPNATLVPWVGLY